jgi:hypothetical protein
MSGELHNTIDSALEAVLRPKTEEIRHELAARLHDEWEKAMQGRGEKALQARAEATAALAAAVRRIRAESSVTTIANALVESAAEFAGRAALLIVRDGRLLGFLGGGGAGDEVKRRFEQVDLSVSEATAMAHAIETRDPVVTGGSANDLSRSIVDVFGLTAEDRVYLFPVVLRDQVLAVLYADAGPASRAVESDAIEVLASVAEAWIEAVGSRKKPVPAREEAAV